MSQPKHTFEELKEKYESELEWDESTLQKKLNQLPSLIGKYQSMMYSTKKLLIKQSKEHDDVWLDRFTYYKTEYEFSLSDAQIKQFLDRDKELGDIKKKMSDTENLFNWAESCKKNLESMGWNIKNYIDYAKIQAGMY